MIKRPKGHKIISHTFPKLSHKFQWSAPYGSIRVYLQSLQLPVLQRLFRIAIRMHGPEHLCAFTLSDARLP
jgi:hypothetical protein